MASTINALTSGGGLAVSGDTSGSLQLQTNNGTTAMTIDTSQNVGIGTSSPAVKLHVNGSGSIIRVATDTSSSGTIDLSATSTSAVINANTYATAVPLVFQTASTERMRIDSTGNLLIGQTGTGTQNANGWDFNRNAQAYFNHISGTVNGTGYALFSLGGSIIGSITQSGTTAVQYNTSSDYRLKENIAPMTGALDKVAQLNPVTYTWKADGSDGQGFIAHELQAVVPDCVTGEKDAVDAEGKPVYQGIDTSFLVATLTASIQELKAIVDAQAERIAVLEAK